MMKSPCAQTRVGFFVPGNTRSMSWKAYETDGASCISYAILVQRVDGLYAPIHSVNPYGTVGCEGNVCVLPETDCVTIRFPGSHPDAAH